jgi:hypothetical protein
MPDDAAARSALDAAIANANAAEARGDHAGRAAAATEALALKQAAYRPLPPENPRTGAEASALLDHLNRTSPEWRAAVLSGRSDVVNALHDWNKLIADSDPVSLAAVGITPPQSSADQSGAVAGGPELVAAFNHSRDIGELATEGDQAIAEEFMRDARYDAAEYELAKQVHRELTNDPNFLKKLAAKDPFTQKLFTRVSMVIAAGPDSSLPRNETAERLLQDRWAAHYRGGRIT